MKCNEVQERWEDYARGKLNKAEECINQALNLAEKYNLINDKIGVFRSLGLYYREGGNLDKAIKFYLKSLNLSKRVNDVFKVIENYTTLARIYEDQEKYSEAYRNYSEALKNYSKISNPASSNSLIAPCLV